MNEYYFISGLPRSGSTLLSTILNQNPNIYAGISSPLFSLIGSVIDSLSFEIENCLIEENHRKEIIHSLFNGYFYNFDNKIIFDTNRSWTKYSMLLKYLFPYTKILCCVRNISSIINSFEKLHQKNCLFKNYLFRNFKTKEDFSHNIFSRVECLMGNNGIISNPLLFLKEIYYRNPEMILFIEYENLCKNPKKEVEKIYNFIEKQNYNHNFDNLFSNNYSSYDKILNLEGLHDVRKKVEHKKESIILPTEIIKEYSGLEFWRNSFCTSNANYE
jgi:sulfotransferase